MKTKFAIYNYNFLRIIEPDTQTRIEFPDWERVDAKVSFEQRQLLLDELLTRDFDAPFPFENAKKKRYWHRQIVRPEESVYVMRVANVTDVTITDENLTDRNYKDYRNCLVIIDNRPGIQRIAIERKTKAFSDTKTVANILEASLSKLLRAKLLEVKLTAVYATHVFWETVQDYPLGFKKVRFHFPPLNLVRLKRVIDRYLNLAREDWDSDIDIAFNAREGGSVKIDRDNPRQKALVEGAAEAGVWVEMYPRDGKRKVIYCGKDQFVVQEIDEAVFQDLISDHQGVIAQIGEAPMDKVKRFMKLIPEAFS